MQDCGIDCVDRPTPVADGIPTKTPRRFQNNAAIKIKSPTKTVNSNFPKNIMNSLSKCSEPDCELNPKNSPSSSPPPAFGFFARIRRRVKFAEKKDNQTFSKQHGNPRSSKPALPLAKTLQSPKKLRKQWRLDLACLPLNVVPAHSVKKPFVTGRQRHGCFLRFSPQNLPFHPVLQIRRNLHFVAEAV